MGHAGVPLTAAEMSEILRREALGERPIAIAHAINRPRQTVDGFLQRHYHGPQDKKSRKRERAVIVTSSLDPNDPGQACGDYRAETRRSVIAQDCAFMAAMRRAHPDKMREPA